MQTYTFRMTGIKEGKPKSMFVTCGKPEGWPESDVPLLQAENRAYRLFEEVIGNAPYTWIYIGDVERWFMLMNDPYITEEDHDWLHMGEDAIRCWQYFGEGGEFDGQP